MAGKLRTRTRPTVLARWIRTAIAGQLHECADCGHTARIRGVSVGQADYRAPRCEDCGAAMRPSWLVMDSRGQIRGMVIGASHAEALKSAKQTPKYDSLKSFTVVPE